MRDKEKQIPLFLCGLVWCGGVTHACAEGSVAPKSGKLESELKSVKMKIRIERVGAEHVNVFHAGCVKSASRQRGACCVNVRSCPEHDVVTTNPTAVHWKIVTTENKWRLLLRASDPRPFRFTEMGVCVCVGGGSGVLARLTPPPDYFLSLSTPGGSDCLRQRSSPHPDLGSAGADLRRTS